MSRASPPSCKFVYQPGQAKGMPWPTPLACRSPPFRFFPSLMVLISVKRVQIDLQWPLSGLHSIMMINSAQPVEGAGGGLHSFPLSLNIHHYEQSYGVRQLRGQIHSPYFSSTLFSSVVWSWNASVCRVHRERLFCTAWHIIFHVMFILKKTPMSCPHQPCSADFYNLKGLSHEIDFKNFDKNFQNLT